MRDAEAAERWAIRIAVPTAFVAAALLPIELSLRGARWQEKDAATDAFDALDERSEVVDEQVEELWELVASALSRIGALKTAALSRRPPRSRGS